MAKRPGRLTGKAAKRNTWWRKRRNQVIVASIAVLAVGGVGLSVALDDSSSSAVAESPGDEWQSGIVFDLARMSQGTLDYIRIVNEWREAKNKPADVSLAAEQALEKYLEARDLLATRRPFEQAPRALDNYRDAVEVYIVHARLTRLSTFIEDKALLNQTQLVMSRLRYLADRLYDLGGEEMAPYTVEGSSRRTVDGYEFTKPIDVPKFATGDWAPGPPLSGAAPVAGPEREYQEVRPENEFPEWQAVVENAEIPAADEVADTLTGGSVVELAGIADELTGASDTLYAAPDPRDERLVNTRIQVGLLVESEAARVAQIARLAPAKHRADAMEMAKSLALVGSRGWDERLGERDLGFPGDLLTTRPPYAPAPYVEPTSAPETPGARPDPSAEPSATATPSASAGPTASATASASGTPG